MRPAAHLAGQPEIVGADMRRVWVLIIGLTVVFGFVAEWMVTQLTLADFARRPVVGFERLDEEGTPLERLILREEDDIFGDQALGTVRFGESAGVPLGFRYTYAAPEGARIACTHLWRLLWCDGGWTAIRP